jgi:hypothetical protein
MKNTENSDLDNIQDERWIDRTVKKYNTLSLFFYIIATTPLAFALGVWSGSRILLPLIITISAYPVFLVTFLRKWYKRLILLMILWTVLISFMGILITRCEPELMEQLTIRGTVYKMEMWEWIETGGGAEGTISIFLPQHLIHLGLFIVASIISGGFLGLFMGTILLNYMNYYVGMLGVNATSDIVMLFGWPPWAILRVIGYIILSVVFARPLFTVFRKERLFEKRVLGYFFAGILLIVFDILIKYLLADWWRDIILRWIILE